MRRMIIFPELLTSLPGMLIRFLRTVAVRAFCHSSDRIYFLKISARLYERTQCQK